MSAMHLWIFPAIALAIFVLVFLGVLILVAGTPRDRMQRNGRLPLDSD